MNARLGVLVALFMASSCLAQTLTLQDMNMEIPQNWKLHQDTQDDGSLIFGFRNKNSHVQLFVRLQIGMDFQKIFVNGSTVLNQDSHVTYGIQDWMRWETTIQLPKENGSQVRFVSAFATEYRNHSYYGYATSDSLSGATAAAESFLNNLELGQNRSASISRSLTGKDYVGKKYYLGFADYLSGFMGNEVKYDIKHTHDIFTKDIGGSYISNKVHGAGQGSAQIRQKWKEFKSKMTWNDMYVQYSSGHGHYSGLAIGVSYDEIRDNALSYPAKEIVIFLMACHSGGVVVSFDKKKDQWSNWNKSGRTLFVMASSKHHELSHTGPGTDPEEPGGPNGSAGSAFGHALWKALIGHSDGYGSGVKDGFITLGEIQEYATWKTKTMKGHTPIHTGVFDPALIMNKVPSQAQLAQFKGGTEGLSESEIIEKIQELNQELRVLR